LSKTCRRGTSDIEINGMAELKPVRWIAGSKDDQTAMPGQVQRQVGRALKVAQEGGKHPDAKVLKGFRNAKVAEIMSRTDRETFRVVYTVQFAKAVYDLHAFQKKSTRGDETPLQEDLDVDIVVRPKNPDTVAHVVVPEPAE
jgi:phage-related protein